MMSAKTPRNKLLNPLRRKGGTATGANAAVDSFETTESLLTLLVMNARLSGEIDREQLRFMVDVAERYEFIGEAPSEEDHFLN
jgi:hypothetical protein